MGWRKKYVYDDSSDVHEMWIWEDTGRAYGTAYVVSAQPAPEAQPLLNAHGKPLKPAPTRKIGFRGR